MLGSTTRMLVCNKRYHGAGGELQSRGVNLYKWSLCARER